MTDQGNPTTYAPGWYDDGHGRKRWYDGTQWTNQYEPLPKKPRVRVPILAMWILSAAALLLGLGIGAGASGGDRAKVAALSSKVATLQNTIDGMKDHEAEVAQREKDVAARENAAAVVEQEAAATRIPGEGVFLVGSDIKAGTYKSVDNAGCYWERLRGVSGAFDDIIANANVTGQAIVKIKSSDVAFTSTRCNEWQRVD